MASVSESCALIAMLIRCDELSSELGYCCIKKTTRNSSASFYKELKLI